MIIINIIERTYNINEANKIAKKHNINIDIVKFLLARGIEEDTMLLLLSKENIPMLPNNSLTNVDKAATLINKYLRGDNSNIYIFGDYDSDGVNATYIMYNALVELAEAIESNVTINYYLPERTEGYGLNMEWCKSIIGLDNTLVITVDNGITKKEEVEFLKSNNVEVIITDHHQPQQGLVPKCMIVDAHYNNDDINGKGLCGAAVAYKVIAYLYQDIYEYDFMYVQKYIAHACIATITDMMPFTDENITFVSNGLKCLNDYPYEGLEYAPVTESMYYFAEMNKGAGLKPKDIAFGFGPQINSCGRMGSIDVAMKFMLGSDTDELTSTFKEMDSLNEERKAQTKVATASIEPPALTDLALVARVSNAEGIVGSIATNLCATYNMPTIIFTETNDEFMSGSARCPEGYNLQTLFNNTKHVVFFGGHSGAAGITIKTKDYDKFVKSFNKAVSKVPVEVTVADTVVVDRIITESDINKNFINKYDNILFFNEFTRPVYGLKNVQIVDYHTSKNNPNNICFHIKNKNREIKVWCWGYGNTYKAMGEPKLVDMVGTLEVFNGMYVIDIHNIEAV